MTVTAIPERGEVILTRASGATITLTWSGALLLGTLLREASVQAEPVMPAGKHYAPSVGGGTI
jgi:hypothetical protein